MIVVDAAAAVLGLLNDGEARRRLAIEDLHAPHLIDSEVTHAMRAQVLRGRLESEEAWRALDRWQRLGLRRYGVVGLLARMWDLRHNLSAYDASYVALAEGLGYPLMTADARLANAPGLGCDVVTVRS